MKIIMVAVMSTDGFITRGEEADVSSWNSPEDKAFFAKIRTKHKLFVMGRRTFEALSIIPTPDICRVVLTSKPELFAAQEVPGQLEFRNLKPGEFVSAYKHYDSCLLLGGSHLYESFLLAGLVNELYLTQEPVVHGSGTPLLRSARDLTDVVRLPTPHITDMNTSGTKLFHYIL